MNIDKDLLENVLESYCVACGSKGIYYEEHKEGTLYICLNPKCEKEWWVYKNNENKEGL